MWFSEKQRSFLPGNKGPWHEFSLIKSLCFQTSLINVCVDLFLGMINVQGNIFSLYPDGIINVLTHLNTFKVSKVSLLLNIWVYMIPLKFLQIIMTTYNFILFILYAKLSYCCSFNIFGQILTIIPAHVNTHFYVIQVICHFYFYLAIYFKIFWIYYLNLVLKMRNIYPVVFLKGKKNFILCFWYIWNLLGRSGCHINDGHHLLWTSMCLDDVFKLLYRR